MKKFILAWLLTAVSSVAFASSTIYITFTALPATQGNGTSTNENNTNDFSYNGYSIATVGGIPLEDLVCDDFDQGTGIPSSQLTFYVNTLSTLSTTDGTAAAVDFSTATGFVTGLTGEGSGMTQAQAYDTAAILLSDLQALGTEDTATKQEIADINYALWDLMEPGKSNGSFLDSPLDGATAQSGSGANTVNASIGATAYLQNAFNTVVANSTTTQNIEKTLVIYTPTSSGQEFIGLGTPIANPEPASWLLMMALALLLFVPQVRSRLSAGLSRK